MKIVKCALAAFSLISLSGLTSCAAGSATAGYALQANSADSLSAAAEARIVERTKREILSSLAGGAPATCAPYSSSADR